MIRKFIAIAALCLVGSMASMVPATAAPFDDVCVLDLAQPATVDYALGIPDGEDCPAIVADVRLDPTSLGGDQGEAAPALCATVQQNALDFAHYRLHVDPGRCLG